MSAVLVTMPHHFPPPSSGEVAASYADGGGVHGAFSISIMICNLAISRPGLSPSSGRPRHLPAQTGEGLNHD